MQLGAAALLAVSAAIAGCYAPSFPSGLPCSESGDCPVGQTCEATRDVCVASGEDVRDATTVDGGGGPGTPIDAAADPSIDAADNPSSDAGNPDASATEINCGTVRCNRETQICCVTGPPSITTTCTAIETCSGLRGRCDGPEDCTAGMICCGEQAGTSCKAAAACTGFPASQLCHSEADCPGDYICRPSDSYPWPICAAFAETRTTDAATIASTSPSSASWPFAAP